MGGLYLNFFQGGVYMTGPRPSLKFFFICFENFLLVF